MLALGAPTGLSVAAGNAQVAVSWTAVNGATSYTVHYSQSTISDLNASGVRAVNVTGAGVFLTTTATVTGLSINVRYYFRVTATGAGGRSAASNEVSATPRVSAPGANAPTKSASALP